MSGGKLHSMHGRDHGPRSADPIATENIHLFGATGEPALQNGWTQISGYAASGFYLAVGAPGQPKQSLEVILNVTGGAAGTVVATLPVGWFNFANGLKVAIHGHDSLGAYRAFHLDGATGSIVEGV